MGTAPQPRQALHHKIAAPKAHRNAVEREHLLSRIFGSDAARVTVFQGPAGHGKTSLMLQAQEECRRRGMLTGWISLDESDNDLSRFLGHVQEMVAALHAEAQLGPPPAPAAPRGNEVATRTDWLATQLLETGHPVAVFFDDLHFVSSRLMLGFMREMLATASDGIRWFLASRLVPEIGLPRLVVGDQALVIRAEELRFSRQETARFFASARDVAVSDAEIQAIHDETEGWPAAVQLYRLAIDIPSVRESLSRGGTHQVRELADYLADNVLARQEPRVQDFLLKTSILSRMSAPLCDALLVRTGSQEILAGLERTGLFVRRVESDQRWFTYHALFSRFLQDHLRAAHPDIIGHLHRRAAEWHESQGNFEDALHHYSSAGEHGRAADVFETWADQLVPDGHMVTVDAWADRVPLEELEKRPGLVCKIVWAQAFLSRRRKIGPLLRLLRAIPPERSQNGDPKVASAMVAIMEDDLAECFRWTESTDAAEMPSSRFRAFELSAVNNARGYYLMGEGKFEDALRYLARGRTLSDGAGTTFTWAYSIGKTALTVLSQGQLQEALTQFRTGLSDPRMFVGESVSTACLACGLVATLYEANDLDAALAQFREYREIIQSAGIHDYLVIAYRAIARIHDHRGEAEEALSILDEAENLSYAGQWPRAVRLIGWERVRRELVAGRVDRARIVAGRLDDDPMPTDIHWVRISEESEDTIIGRARLAVHAGEAKAALQIITPAARDAVMHRRVQRQIKLHALAALAYRKQGNANLAHRSVDQALALAAPGGYVRSFLDEGEEMGQLLLDHVRARSAASPVTLHTESAALLSRLIGAHHPESQPSKNGHGADRAASPPASVEPFTEREKRILSMMANYLSNEQIAAAMFVTRDTVKYHLKNIYGKLGVRSRLDAIRSVRERQPDWL
ncbi:MAG TPA: LuxR C-terminal-related transcriptional regulator [Nevskiaceae bacterium]|nr:LuxR C-terminal-related transcriptional regulator [Nevskiaceae bacterium]